MPELPEMRALSERIDAAFKGAPFKGAAPLSFTGLKTVAPDPATLNGRALVAASSRGKFLILDFEGPRILVHLSQGGRVDVEMPAKVAKPKGAVVRFGMGDGAMLVKEYGTERKAGWWVLADGDDGPLAGLGPEPYDKPFGELVLHGADTRRLHTMLRDQHTVAGIGRGYADDILHRAKLSPYASLSSLDDAKRATLLAAVRDILDQGLIVERRRKGGLPTKIGDHWIVHGRFGERCPVCGDDLRRVSYESYEVAYCPACQTGGAVLADRRLSKLLK